MSDDDRRPRIDKITLTSYRRGKCAGCGGSTERQKSFAGPSYEPLKAEMEAWEAQPLKHRRCE